MFFNKNGVLAYGGAFGPAKLLNTEMAKDYNNKVEKNINLDTEIDEKNKQRCIDKFATKNCII